MTAAIKKAFLLVIAQAWDANPPMHRVVNAAWIHAGNTPADDVRKYTDMAASVRARHIESQETLRVWLARNLPKMSDALFDGRPESVCFAIGMAETGSQKTARRTVSARSLDRKHDWNVCK